MEEEKERSESEVFEEEGEEWSISEHYVRIPQDRIGVLIGKGGSVKAALESRTSSKIDVDSKDGSVVIRTKDPLMALRVVDVVRAIARGFSPERAFVLLDDDSFILDIISLSHLSEKALRRVKGRIIGKNGRTRQLIEELTGTRISVYGKTVGIIGYPEQVRVARAAIEMLVDGTPHGAVYSYLERKRRELQESYF
ncbi:MAG: rRNA processing protein Krr1/Pno1 [Candidatus Alkanophagales archaeon MCA70_species_1]|nr:rRNA processing protein Krr1/Pno1 [Candidatus Alkanophaga volatiphilum]